MLLEQSDISICFGILWRTRVCESEECTRRTNIQLTAADRKKLESVVATIRKAHLASEDLASDGGGHGTAEIIGGHRQVHDGDLALAGTVRPRRRSAASAGQDAASRAFHR